MSADDRLTLWLHCVSEHAVRLAPEMTYEELLSYHRGEHRGPGTIRNHSKEGREFLLSKVALVLLEEDDVDRPDASEAYRNEGVYVYRANWEGQVHMEMRTSLDVTRFQIPAESLEGGPLKEGDTLTLTLTVNRKSPH